MALPARVVGIISCATLVVGCNNSAADARGAYEIDVMLAALKPATTWGAMKYVRVPLPTLPEIEAIVFDPLSTNAEWINPANKEQQKAVLAILDDWERRLAQDTPSVEPDDPNQVARSVQTAVSAYIARSRIEAQQGDVSLAARDCAQAISIAWDALEQAPGTFFADQAAAFLIAADHATALSQDRRLTDEDLARLRSATNRFKDFDLEAKISDVFSSQRAMFAAAAKSGDPVKIAGSLTSPMGDQNLVLRKLDDTIRNKRRALDWRATAELCREKMYWWHGAADGRLIALYTQSAQMSHDLVGAWGFDPVRTDYATFTPSGKDLPGSNAVGVLLVSSATSQIWPMCEAAGRCRLAAMGVSLRVAAEQFRLTKGAYPQAVSDLPEPVSPRSRLWAKPLKVDFKKMSFTQATGETLIPSEDLTERSF